VVPDNWRVVRLERETARADAHAIREVPGSSPHATWAGVLVVLEESGDGEVFRLAGGLALVAGMRSCHARATIDP
jgi:hypothetical protein